MALWDGLAKSALGIALPGVGGLLGDAITNITGFGGSDSTTGGAIAGMDATMGKMAEWNKLGATNAAGQTGYDAALGAQRALDSHRNSVTTLNDANAMRQSGDNAMSAVGTTHNIARMNADNANRAIRNSTNNMIAQSGGSPAAIVAAAGKMSEATGQNNLNFLGQAGQQSAQANAARAAAYGQAQNALQTDLAGRFEQRVKPYLNDYTNLPGMYGAVSQNTMQDTMVSRPLAGAGAAMGNIGRNVLENMFRDGTLDFLSPDSANPGTTTNKLPS